MPGVLVAWWLAFRRSRLRRWSEVSVGDEARSRRIILLRLPPRPYLIRFSCRLDDVARVAFAARGNCDLRLQVGAIDFCPRGFQAIERTLRRMAVTIPRAIGNDRHFRFHTINEVLRSSVLRSMMGYFQNLRL